jgi:hypothetical protein
MKLAKTHREIARLLQRAPVSWPERPCLPQAQRKPEIRLNGRTGGRPDPELTRSIGYFRVLLFIQSRRARKEGFILTSV